MKSQIKRWDKDAAVLIPIEFLVEAKINVDPVIDVSVVDGKIVIQALNNTEKMFPYTEAELLRGLTPETAHADELNERH